MATFAELCADVVTLTARPDLVNETKMAVKAATLKIHQMDFFYKDLFETGISFNQADYTQVLACKELIPLYRAMKYVRKSDASGGLGNLLSVITPAQIFDSYGYQKSDVCYGAGNVIQIKSSTELQYILFGCYVHPDLSEDKFNSWVAVDHPYSIIYEAATTLFKAIGHDEKATIFNKLAADQMQLVKISNVELEGV